MKLENKKTLLKSMNNLSNSFGKLINALETIQLEDKIDINDFIVDNYPFKYELYEQYSSLFDWLESIENNIKKL